MFGKFVLVKFKHEIEIVMDVKSLAGFTKLRRRFLSGHGLKLILYGAKYDCFKSQCPGRSSFCSIGS